MKRNQLARVRQALLRHFGPMIGPDAKQIIKEATFTGRTDPGEWSPKACVVVHCESGIPSGTYSIREQEKWFDISRELGDIYAEHVNSCVVAFYNS